MKYNRVISTAVLFLLLGTTLPAFAQKGEEGKGGGGQKAQPAQHQAQPQHAQQAQHQAQPQRAQERQQPQRQQQAQRQQPAQHQAQPQRAQQTQRQAEPQRTQQAQRPARQQTQTVAYNGGNNGNRGNGNNGNHYGRISDDHYRANFGHDHHFHMGRPQMIGGYNRFQYGGYWFGYNQGWPIGWGYNDNVYVAYEGGGYYMYDLMHPGIHISLNLF